MRILVPRLARPLVRAIAYRVKQRMERVPMESPLEFYAWTRRFDRRGNFLHWSGFWQSCSGCTFKEGAGYSEWKPSSTENQENELSH